jgi:transcriptional regulator with XRE-family HTH domain
MTKKNNVLGENVRRLRNLRGLTTQQLADRCNMTQSAISKIENGDVWPGKENWLRIAKELGVAPEDAGNLFNKSYEIEIPTNQRRIPLFTEESAARYLGRNGDRQVKPLAMRLASIDLSDDAFMVIVKGNANDPDVKDGDELTFEKPHSDSHEKVHVEPDKFVFALVRGVPYIRKYYACEDSEGRPAFQLVPVNRAHRTFRSEVDGIEICGIAVRFSRPM